MNLHRAPQARRGSGSAPSIPRFHILPILATGMIVWLLMSAFFIFFFSQGQEIRSQLATAGTELASAERHVTGLARSLHQAAGQAAPPPGLPGFAPPNPRELFRDHKLESSLITEFGGTVLCALAVLIWLRPVSRWFRDLRLGRAPREAERMKVQQRLRRSALLIGLVMPAFLMVYQIVWILAKYLLVGEIGAVEHDLAILPDQFLITGLSGLFMYLWQRHRTQRIYLAHVHPAAELIESLPPGKRYSIRLNLMLMVLLSTILPIGIIIRLLTSGLSAVPAEFSQLSADQIGLLFGGAGMGPGGMESLMWLKDTLVGRVPPVYVNAVDTLRILAGIAIGCLIVVPYVVAIVRWTAMDMVVQVDDLRRSMRRVTEGDLDATTPVLANNELGDLTLGFNTMLRGLEERNRIKGLFGQYLTNEVSEAILDGRVNLNGDHYEATVMFTDIRSFTALSETMEPAEVFEFLNDYLNHMIDVILAEGGFIDKFIGDGILSVFGLPVRSGDHAARAVATAQAMSKRLAELNAARVAAGKPAIAIGSGIHTGPVIAGNVGNSRRAQFTVIGDTVNLASRLESLNKDYGSTILLSQTTWEALTPEQKADIQAERIGGVEIRGKREPITVWRVG